MKLDLQLSTIRSERILYFRYISICFTQGRFLKHLRGIFIAYLNVAKIMFRGRGKEGKGRGGEGKGRVINGEEGKGKRDGSEREEKKSKKREGEE